MVKKDERGNHERCGHGNRCGFGAYLLCFTALDDTGAGVHYDQSGRRTRSNWVGHGGW